MLEETSCPKLPLRCSKTFNKCSLRKQDSFVAIFGSVEKIASALNNLTPSLFHDVNQFMTDHHHQYPSLKTKKSYFIGKKVAIGFFVAFSWIQSQETLRNCVKVQKFQISKLSPKIDLQLQKLDLLHVMNLSKAYLTSTYSPYGVSSSFMISRAMGSSTIVIFKHFFSSYS